MAGKNDNAQEPRLYDYGPSPNCYKVRLLLTQLGRSYERVPVDIFAGDTLSDDYAAINPARRTPVWEEEPGDYLPESNAILLHLAEGTPLLPSDSAQRAQVYRWLFFEQTAVFPIIGGLRFLFLSSRLEPDSADLAPAQRSMGIVESHLRDRDFIVGDAYGLADLALYGYLHLGADAALDMSRYPSVDAWLGRVAKQPGHINDVEPYPGNAQLGAGRSIYDSS